MPKYVVKKNVIDKKNIERIKIVFDNNDFVCVSGEDVVSLDFNFYDRLVGDERGFAPLVANGEIKLKIMHKLPWYYKPIVYNQKEYDTDYKKYIEKRCCDEQGIVKVIAYNENNFETPLLGNIYAEMDGEYLVLKYSEKSGSQPYGSKEYCVKLRDVNTSEIMSIDLCCENCDVLQVYHAEIKEVNLKLSETLCGENVYNRLIVGGYIKVDLEEGDERGAGLFQEGNKRRNTLKDYEKIISLGKTNLHDICDVEIIYEDTTKENIWVKDVRPEEKLKELDDHELLTGERLECDFLGGYFKKKKNLYTIVFSENPNK